MELSCRQLIKLHTQTQVLIGNIYYSLSSKTRLLDALNGLTNIGPVKNGRFLELTDVTFQHADGGKEELKVCYIIKGIIQLIATLSNADSARGIGAQDGSIRWTPLLGQQGG